MTENVVRKDDQVNSQNDGNWKKKKKKKKRGSYSYGSTYGLVRLCHWWVSLMRLKHRVSNRFKLSFFFHLSNMPYSFFTSRCGAKPRSHSLKGHTWSHTYLKQGLMKRQTYCACLENTSYCCPITADSCWLFQPVGPHQCSAGSVASWAQELMPSLDAAVLNVLSRCDAVQTTKWCTTSDTSQKIRRVGAFMRRR